MSFRRKISLISLALALLWVPLLIVGITGSLNLTGWIVAIASFLVWASQAVAVFGAPWQVKRDGGSLRAAVSVWTALYLPTLVRRLARIDEEERTMGVPPLGPILVRRAWSDGQGGWWAEVEVIRDSDLERWQDMRGEVLRALAFRWPVKDGEALRIEKGSRPGLMRWTYFGRDTLGGVREARTAPSLEVRFGRYESGGDALIDLREAVHIALQGMTRSGKSSLGYVLVSALAQCATARLWGIDPNSVFLGPVAQVTDRSRFVLGTDPEGAAELLERFVGHMDERNRSLLRRGIDKIEDFDAEPLDILILEEWPSLMRSAASDRKLKARIEDLVGRVLAEGAKSGIRVILIAQRLSTDVLKGDVRGQFGARLTMRVDALESVRMLHADADKDVLELVKTFPAGRGLFGYLGREEFVQADLMSYAQFRASLGAEADSSGDLIVG